MRTRNRGLAYGLLLGVATALLTSSCGGGGSAAAPPPSPSPPGSVTFSTRSVSFKAAGPYAQSPGAMTIVGTVTGVTSGTVYVKVVANNTITGSPNGFFTVTNMTLSGDTGQAEVIPAIPSSIGAGLYKGTITISVCLDDPTCQTGQLAGSPATLPVNYDIASGVDGDTVTPRVVTANAPGTVILRGSGFTGAKSVEFGSVAASSVTVVSDTEIDVSYPALPAGTYPVTVDSGSIGYGASLVAVSPPVFAATVIAYPAGAYQTPSPMEMQYDAQRQALFLLFPQGTYSPNLMTNTLVRYAFAGGTWTAAAQASINNAEQFAISPDGTHLLVLAQNLDSASMLELDPVTLAQTNATVIDTPYACGFALANDGNAILPLSAGPGFVFGTFSRVLTPMADAVSCSPIAASGNGAIVSLNGSTFLASSETVVQSGPDGWVADFAGDKYLNGDAVENQAGQVLGHLGTAAVVLNGAGTRAYGYIPDPYTCAPTLATFDLTATPAGSPPEFPVVGTPVALPAGCDTSSTPSQLTLTPDGGTMFISTSGGVIVEPLSP